MDMDGPLCIKEKTCNLKILAWGRFAVLGDSYWSRGLVLRIFSREKILKGTICFKLANKYWKTYSENLVKVDTSPLPSLASSKKRQNVT